MSRQLVDYLPKGKPFSVIDAVYSLTMDMDRGASVTVSGMAARWGWTRRQVRWLLESAGLEIQRSDNAENSRCGGMLVASGQQADSKRTASGQQVINIFSSLSAQADSKRTASGQQADTTNDTIDTVVSTDVDTTGACAPEKKYSVDDLRPKGWWTVEQWNELKSLRKSRKGSLRERAMTELVRQFELSRQAGETAETLLTLIDSKGWRGYQHDWLLNVRKSSLPVVGQGQRNAMTPRNQREAMNMVNNEVAPSSMEYLESLKRGGGK